MTEPYTSAKFGYSLRHPAGWIVDEDGDGPTSDGSVIFAPAAAGGTFRALSVAVPDGVVVDDWIAQTLTYGPDTGCAPPRNTLDPVTIDGHAGRILGFCGTPTAPQIEATVVVDKRAYLFTFLDFREGEGVPNEDWAQAMFDAFAATITLDPQAAGGSPSPEPILIQSGNASGPRSASSRASPGASSARQPRIRVAAVLQGGRLLRELERVEGVDHDRQLLGRLLADGRLGRARVRAVRDAGRVERERRDADARAGS